MESTCLVKKSHVKALSSIVRQDNLLQASAYRGNVIESPLLAQKSFKNLKFNTKKILKNREFSAKKVFERSFIQCLKCS